MHVSEKRLTMDLGNLVLKELIPSVHATFCMRSICMALHVARRRQYFLQKELAIC